MRAEYEATGQTARMLAAGIQRPESPTISDTIAKPWQGTQEDLVHAWANGLYNIRWCLAGPHAKRGQKAKPRLKQKWMTPAVLAAIRRRDQLWKERNASEAAVVRFKAARKAAQAMERAARGQYTKREWD